MILLLEDVRAKKKKIKDRRIFMINFKEDENLNKLNHSCAHLMAQAISHLYPDAKFWVGPVVESGFYYDVDLGDKVINDEDIEAISKEMKKIAKDGKRIIRNEISKSEALEQFKDDPYKIDLIERMDEEITVISTYSQGDFTDLCRGPHVDTVKECKNFKLIKFSGAYWKGDINNKVLQRIYGVCFPSEEELNSYLQELEDAKLRDHRKLGKDLGIFMTNDLVGKGLPMYLPNGCTVWDEFERYIKEKERKLGYKHVLTPPLGNVDLYKTSGHWDHYKDSMFPKMEVEGEEFVLRPMNCPHHMMIYANDIHSYRDLPLRIGEIARDCRFESSGSLKGIERVRSFCQNDAHLFVTPEQIESEFKLVVDLILDVYKDLNITDYHFELSLRDKEDKIKYYPDDEMWDNAENKLREVLDDIGIPYVEKVGEAAFYGPKLDVQVKPAVGNEYTLSTCQLDFCLPARFDLTYVDRDGSKKTPVVIHRAILGSIDRFIAYYLEEKRGVLPLWVSPVQISILPVNNEYHLDYAKKVEEILRNMDIRVELDSRDEKLGYRMRESQMKKVPISLVLGNSERDEETVTIRFFGKEDKKTMKLDEFISYVKGKIDNREYDLD
ncbi:MAG: threonine--tRNA ligase [Bacilli bacterium]|jgi:threonyl-tRNA synthetase|nr:threonine--tRNA ligase [Bacilli bacterium]